MELYGVSADHLLGKETDLNPNQQRFVAIYTSLGPTYQDLLAGLATQMKNSMGDREESEHPPAPYRFVPLSPGMDPDEVRRLLEAANIEDSESS